MRINGTEEIDGSIGSCGGGLAMSMGYSMDVSRRSMSARWVGALYDVPKHCPFDGWGGRLPESRGVCAHKFGGDRADQHRGQMGCRSRARGVIGVPWPSMRLWWCVWFERVGIDATACSGATRLCA